MLFQFARRWVFVNTAAIIVVYILYGLYEIITEIIELITRNPLNVIGVFTFLFITTLITSFSLLKK